MSDEPETLPVTCVECGRVLKRVPYSPLLALYPIKVESCHFHKIWGFSE